MKLLLHLLIIVGLCALAVFVYFAVFDSTRDTTPHPLADEIFVIHGQETNCSTLFKQPCDYTLQSEFNRWGNGLESFIDSNTLGPYATDIGFASSAKLSLQACGVARTAGKTVLEFEDLARQDHPNATRTELFSFWNRTPQGLCPE